MRQVLVWMNPDRLINSSGLECELEMLGPARFAFEWIDRGMTYDPSELMMNNERII